jgi:7 transmembrane receptor (rhodopsin family)
VGVYNSGVSRQVAGIYISLCEFFLPLGIIAFCYVQMAKAVRKVGTINFSAGGGRSGSGASMSRARRNILKLLAIVSMAFFVCVGPRQGAVIAYTVGLHQVDFNGVPYLTTLGLNYFNCCVNPFIYLFQYEEFQNGVRTLCGRKNSKTPVIDVQK